MKPECQQPSGETHRTHFSTWMLWTTGLFLVAVYVAAGWPAWTGFFVSDDFFVIYPHSSSIAEIFLKDWHGGAQGFYRPLILIVTLIERAIWSSTPLGFHMTNLAFHLFNSMLVFLIGRRFFGPTRLAGAATAAIFFFFLPVHYIGVFQVVCRTDIQAALPMLLAVWLASSRRRLGLAAWVCLPSLYLIAILSKEMALTLPALIIVTRELTVLRTLPWRNRMACHLRMAVVLGVSAAVYLAWKYWHFGYFITSGQFQMQVTAGRAVYHLLLGLFLVGEPISAWLNSGIRQLAEGLREFLGIGNLLLLRVLLVSGAAGVAVWLWRASFRSVLQAGQPADDSSARSTGGDGPSHIETGVAALGAVWYLVAMTPVLALIARWYLYIPSIGIAWMLGAIVTRCLSLVYSRRTIRVGWVLGAVFAVWWISGLFYLRQGANSFADSGLLARQILNRTAFWYHQAGEKFSEILFLNLPAELRGIPTFAFGFNRAVEKHVHVPVDVRVANYVSLKALRPNGFMAEMVGENLIRIRCDPEVGEIYTQWGDRHPYELPDRNHFQQMVRIESVISKNTLVLQFDGRDVVRITGWSRQ